MRNRYGWLAVMLGVLAVLAGARAARAAEPAGGGNQLLEACEAVINRTADPDTLELVQAAYCMGMVQGVGNTLALAGQLFGKKLYCPPKGLRDPEAIHAVVRYLKAHKAELSNADYRSSDWAATALIELYPCKQ